MGPKRIPERLHVADVPDFLLGKVGFQVGDLPRCFAGRGGREAILPVKVPHLKSDLPQTAQPSCRPEPTCRDQPLLPSRDGLETVDDSAEVDAPGVPREDRQVPAEIAGVAVERDRLADEEGVFLDVAVVPLVAEIADFQDERHNPRGLPLPGRGILVERHRLRRQPEVFHRDGPEGLPLGHERHSAQAALKKRNIYFLSVGPQQTAPVANLPEADTAGEEMLQYMGKYHQDIIVHGRQQDGDVTAGPLAEILLRKHLLLKGIHAVVDTAAEAAAQRSVKLNHPFVEMHPKVLLLRLLLLHLARERDEELAGLLVIVAIEEKVHIASGTPGRARIALRDPLPLHEHGLDAFRIQLADKAPDELVHRLVSPLQTHGLLEERQHLRLRHRPVRHMLQPRCDNPLHRLIPREPIQPLHIQRLIREQGHLPLPQPRPQQREEQLDIQTLIVQNFQIYESPASFAKAAPRTARRFANLT